MFSPYVGTGFLFGEDEFGFVAGGRAEYAMRFTEWSDNSGYVMAYVGLVYTRLISFF